MPSSSIGACRPTPATAAGDSERLRFVRARAATRLGTMHGDLGELDAARPLLEDAHTTLQQLCAAHANDAPVVYRQELCSCAEQLAQVYARTGKGDDYERCQQQAADGLAALAAATGESRHLEAALRTQLGLARAKARRRKLPEAFAALDAIDRRLADRRTGGAGDPRDDADGAVGRGRRRARRAARRQRRRGGGDRCLRSSRGPPRDPARDRPATTTRWPPPGRPCTNASA
jgi:hypothetical protein